MYADLHIHTNHSDGAQTPREVVAAAKEAGMGVISICDHDLITAYDELRTACGEAGIRLVQGVELDVDWKGKRLHLLGYNFDPDDGDMRWLIEHSRLELNHIGDYMIERMAADFPQIDLAAYETYEYPKHRGGWKAINYLYDLKLSDTLLDGLKYGRQYADYQPRFCPLSIACHVIRKAGGMPVLAHPGVTFSASYDDQVDPDTMIKIMPDLIDQGIGGVECYYTEHTPALTQALVDYCRAHDLRVTCGCDGHGSFTRPPNIEGEIIGNLKVDISQLDLRGIYHDQ